VARRWARGISVWPSLLGHSPQTTAALGGQAMLDLFASLMKAVFEARDRLSGLPVEIKVQ